jgi:hypothetical protein
MSIEVAVWIDAICLRYHDETVDVGAGLSPIFGTNKQPI